MLSAAVQFWIRSIQNGGGSFHCSAAWSQVVSSWWYSIGLVLRAWRISIVLRVSSTLLGWVGGRLISAVAVMVSRRSAIAVPAVVTHIAGGAACLPRLVYSCPVGLVKWSTVRSGSGRTFHSE